MNAPNTSEQHRPKVKDAEFTGTFQRVRWSGNGTTIVQLTDGRAVICPGTTPEFFHDGYTYLFLGQESEYKGQKQIKASSCTRQEASTPDALLAYVTRVGGVSKAVAAKLLKRYGAENLLEKIKCGSAEAVDAKLVDGPTADALAIKLHQSAGREKLLVGLNQMFAGRGFLSSLPDECVKRFGAHAIEWIRRNPFLLLTHKLPSAGVKRCDKLWLELGKDENALKRQFFWLWQGVQDDSNGDTWFRYQKLAGIVNEKFGSAKLEKIMQLGLRSRWLKSREDADGKKWITSRDRAGAEHRVATELQRLMGGEVRWPSTIHLSKEGKNPSTHQLEGISTATQTPVGILVGSPGTGKTFSVAFLIRQALANDSQTPVYLVAPTGKAAVRLTASMQANNVGIKATTIHRMLGRPMGSDGGRFNFNGKNQLPIRNGLFLVDETSMVDTDLMSCLLEAIPTGCNVLFVGDTNQLAPVGHGCPLRDMIAAKLPTGRLTEIQRNAGRIVRCCAEIRDGKPFQFSNSADLAAGENLMLYQPASEEGAVALLETILKSSKRFDPIRETQVIVARNDNTPLSRKRLNPRLAKLLNPDGFRVAGNEIAVGDKVICTANSNAATMIWMAGPEEESASWKIVKDDNDKPVKEYVANGEIGFAIAVGGNDVVVQFEDGRTVQGRFPGAGGGEDASKFELAYAVSGHKMQGSESRLCIILADKQAAMVASREWWYTSISRARELCVVIGAESMIRSQAKRETTGERKTFLRELLTEGVASPAAITTAKTGGQ